jgi:16S rRNA (uracil1498-N3)-methyltransferase
VSLVPFVHVDVPLAGRRADDPVPLGERDRHHLRTVLRLRSGDEVTLADGAGGVVPAVLDDAGAVLQQAVSVQPPPRPVLRVAQGLPKGRKLDEVVRVCTELGVDELVPVAADRCVVRLDEHKAQKAVERWDAVARSASEQARRPFRPRVTPVVRARELAVGDGEVLLVAHPGGTALPVAIEGCIGAATVTVAIGPEGGWSDEEVARWTDRGARPVGLGPTVLRTEHAAAAALAVLAAGLGRWDG